MGASRESCGSTVGPAIGGPHRDPIRPAPMGAALCGRSVVTCLATSPGFKFLCSIPCRAFNRSRSCWLNSICSGSSGPPCPHRTGHSHVAAALRTLTGATLHDTFNAVKRRVTLRDRPRRILINGKEYISASDLAREIGISRQTLWRWRHHGKIPKGYRYRDNRILFTAEEAKDVREFAHKLEPAKVADASQLKLFSGPGRRAR
jgi:hypothetical protein